jgi:hypothetical protein
MRDLQIKDVQENKVGAYTLNRVVAHNPLALEKIFNISMVVLISCSVGFTKATTSLAYKDILKASHPLLRLPNNPIS